MGFIGADFGIKTRVLFILRILYHWWNNRRCMCPLSLFLVFLGIISTDKAEKTA